MKWELNRRTGMMEPVKKTGFCVSGRIGGIMVEDFDNNIQFLINYGTDKITHCIGCSGRDLHLFNEQKARGIAREVARIARAHNRITKYTDYRYFCSSTKNFNESANVDKSMDNNYQLSLLINRLYTASAPFTKSTYRDSSWQNVYAHVEALGKVRGVEDVAMGGGEYFNYFHGTSPDDMNPAYRQYKLTIKTRYGDVEGRLICHSAGTREDPFDRYDMTCTFWKDRYNE